MNAKHLPLTALLALLSFSVCSAQEQRIVAPEKPTLWQVTLGEQMKVAVIVDRIAAVAMHPFYLNGSILVSEVTIDTMGSNTIRFYCVHGEESLTASTDPRTALGTIKKEATRVVTGQQQGGGVIPAVKYPEGTYAHSIEYQVSSPEELEKIYKSLLSALQRVSSNSRDNVKISSAK